MPIEDLNTRTKIKGHLTKAPPCDVRKANSDPHSLAEIRDANFAGTPPSWRGRRTLSL